MFGHALALRNADGEFPVPASMLLSGLAALAVALAACGGSDRSPPTTPTNASARAGSADAATQVIAVETDYHISLSRTSFKPGTYTFIAENKSDDLTHALTITGPGVHKATTILAPGRDASITVTLQWGTYDIYCPVTDHKMLGMNVGVIVH